jgi:hypothetical protein
MTRGDQFIVPAVWTLPLFTGQGGLLLASRCVIRNEAGVITMPGG